MKKNFSPRGIIFAIIFFFSLIGLLYFGLLHFTQPDLSPPAGPLAADKGYGVTIDLPQYDGPALTNSLISLRESNLLWLRQPIRWAEIESSPGQFNWESLDRVFAAVAQHNHDEAQQPFKIIAVLYTTPTWARPANTPPNTPPIEVSDFGQFANAFAVRYGQYVDYYQIWHEPNLSANWGNTYVDPVAYANLLRDAALNIRAVDPTAFILTAALAPTLEEGPLNLNELAYLDQLYQAQARRWFDLVAGQAYGFDSEPSEPASPNALNFNRVELLRQVMLNHGDAGTPIWVTAFGWNALPPDWAGQPAPWQSNTPTIQAQRTATALNQVRRNWPWLGPMLALRWDTTDLAGDDPARGFALAETPEILAAIQSASAKESVATPGRYPADHLSGHYSPDWRFALNQADIPRHEPRTLDISFEGTRLDLTINRGFYRGYLWVTIDGQPANVLPQDGQGRNYVVLYDPLQASETVTLVQDLPPGPHQAVIEAEGGWGQWAISGWTVYHEANTPPSQAILLLTGAFFVLSGIGLTWQFIPRLVEITLRASSWLESLIAAYNQLGEWTHISLTFALAIGLFFAARGPALFLFPLLTLAIFLRPDLGLALVTFSLSFFMASLYLPLSTFAPVELALALTVGGFIFREVLPLLQIPNFKFQIPRLKSADWAALTLIVLGLLATLVAPNFGVSMHEWRVLVLESVIFYFLVRLGRDYGPSASASPPAWRWAWRLIDAFVVGATFHALLALYLYFFTEQSITAEGVRRALGPVYGSPNNLSLFLDRVWPILLAVAFFPNQTASQPRTTTKIRRWLYGMGLVIVSLTLYLTFSKGALLLGLPACIVMMALLYIQHSHRRHWRRIIVIAGGCLALIVSALIPLSQTQRFRTTFDFSEGSTGFFRLKLWQASLTMLRDHWPLGVGLDNFLYQYRTRYILPEAWQESNLSHPHNLILDFGTRLGLGGIVWLGWIQITFWTNAWRLYQKIPASLVLGLMGSMVVVLSHGLVDHAFFLVDLAFVFFLIVGIGQKLAEQSASHPTT